MNHELIYWSAFFVALGGSCLSIHWLVMTDSPLPECLACPDHVDKAEWDRQKFYDEEE